MTSPGRLLKTGVLRCRFSFLSRFRVFSSLGACDFLTFRAVFAARKDTTTPSDSGWNRNQLSHPHEVVSRCRESKDPRHLKQFVVFQLTQQSDVLQPAEAFLDSLSPFLTDGAAGVPRSARVDDAATRSARVLRYVRRHVHGTAFG